MREDGARRPLAILGTSLFAAEVVDVVMETGCFDVTTFIENHQRDKAGTTLLDRPIIWIDDARPLADTHLTLCSLGTTKRRAFVDQITAMGFQFATAIHPTARISRSSRIGAGSFVSVGVVVAAQTEIGRHAVLNRGVLIGHDTRIGDCVTVSPGANVAGAVTIGDGTYIGMGAIVLDRLTIGPGAVIGAGSVVTKDVPPGVQVMGVPARVVREVIDGR